MRIFYAYPLQVGYLYIALEGESGRRGAAGLSVRRSRIFPFGVAGARSRQRLLRHNRAFAKEGAEARRR